MVAAPRPAIRSGRLAGMATAPVLAVPSLSVRTVALYGAVTSHSIRGPSARTGDRLLRHRGPSPWQETLCMDEDAGPPGDVFATPRNCRCRYRTAITRQRMGGIAGR